MLEFREQKRQQHHLHRIRSPNAARYKKHIYLERTHAHFVDGFVDTPYQVVFDHQWNLFVT